MGKGVEVRVTEVIARSILINALQLQSNTDSTYQSYLRRQLQWDSLLTLGVTG